MLILKTMVTLGTFHESAIVGAISKHNLRPALITGALVGHLIETERHVMRI